MSRNRVEVSITGDDRLSPVLDRLADKAQGMRGIFGSALGFGMDLASKALGGFMKSVDQANNAVVDNVKSVGGLASAMGQSFEKADQLNNAIVAGLAKQAAALPGTTDDYVQLYRAISDDVATANKELNKGKFDAKSYEKQIVSLASKFQVLGDGMPVSRTIQSMQSLLGGRSLKQLGKLQYFMKNPVLLKNLEKELKGKKLQDLTSGERLQLSLKALDLSLTDDTVKKLTGTFDAIKQSFLTNLFDPNVGAFGLLRDVDGNLQNGVQNAFQALTEALDSVIGSNGVFNALGDLMKGLGINLGDPMVMLRGAAQGFAATMRGVAEFFRSVSKMGDVGAMSDRLVEAPAMVAKKLAELVNGAVGSLGNVDMGKVAQIGGKVITAVVKAIDAFFSNLSPQTLLAGGAAMIAIGGLLPIVGVGVAAVVGAIAAATAGLPVLLIAGAATVLVGLGMLIYQNFGAIVSAIGGFFGNLVSMAVSAISSLVASVASAIFNWRSVTGFALGGFFGAIAPLVVAAASGLLGQVSGWIGNFVSGVASAISGFFSNLAAQVSSAISSIRIPIPGMGGGGGGQPGNAARGFIPGTGLGGLLGAAISEARAMPSGAGLMLANDSEMILNRAQQAAMAGALSGGRGGTFAPQIMVQAMPGMDINALANEVMYRINDSYRSYEQGFLA